MIRVKKNKKRNDKHNISWRDLQDCCQHYQWKCPLVAAPASWLTRWGRKLPQYLWPWTCDLDLQPWPLRPWPWKVGWKLKCCIVDLDLWPLWPRPWPSWLYHWTTFSDTRLKTEKFTFLTLVTLTLAPFQDSPNNCRYTSFSGFAPSQANRETFTSCW